MTSLNDIKGFNEYCGPAVLAALTGESTDRCADTISMVSGKKEIKGVQREHLVASLKRLNFEVKEVKIHSSTLFGVLNELYSKDGKYVIGVPRHVVAVEVKDKAIWFIDNHTKHPINAQASTRLTQKVEVVWKVEAGRVPKYIGANIIIRKINDRSLEVISHNEYENPMDNTNVHLGTIRYVDLTELKEIIGQLNDYVDQMEAK